VKQILFISYFFPPLGGPGVQRACKMIRYLKEKGWVTDVISIKDIIFHSYDKEMFWECNVRKVYRTDSLHPMFFLKRFQKSSIKRNNLYFRTPEKIKKLIRNIFPIDDKIGWLPFAYFKALQICKKNKYDVVIATIGPYTSGILAYLISQRIRIPVVIDYRDLWTLHPYLKFPTVFHRQLSEFWEQKILERAKIVTVASKTMKKDLAFKYGNCVKDKIYVMYNGWDARDFKNIKVAEKKDKVRFGYIGNFYGNQSVRYFVKALDELLEKNSLPRDIEITFVGNYYIETIRLLHNSKIVGLIKIVPQVSHRKAVEFMLNSDVLLLFVSSKKGRGVLTGKIFEYLYAKKEILAMIPPDGEAAEILRSYNHKYICAMEDNEKIKENFIDICKFVKSKKYNNQKIDNQYSRENQFNQFETFLLKRVFRDEI